MRIYKLTQGLIIELNDHFYQIADIDWDSFINDDHLFEKANRMIANLKPISNAQELIATRLDAPMANQELWASGVTYFRSKQGRQEESKEAGGADFYARVYEAERPELFFKATRNRVVGSGGLVKIRKDSTWDVPEPELVLMISSKGKIIGYTIGNDMSSRSIEGENPLYLPQAKTYDGCAALGPCIYVVEKPLPKETKISVKIRRNQVEVFAGDIEISQIKRSFEELAGFLFRECSFQHGALLMTGTGIVPDKSFTLKSGDEIEIGVEAIGSLINKVA